MLKMLKPMFALVAVTLVASFLLGLVYTVTEGPIAEQKAKAETEAIASLIEGTVSTEIIDLDTLTNVEPAEGRPLDFPASVTRITKCLGGDGAVLGHIFSVSPKGYGGSIDMMVGVSGGPIGTVEGIEIISHAETPGLGANADTPEFAAQYEDKTNAGSLTVTKMEPVGEDEIEAIASATITTEAVTSGVNQALTFYVAFQLGVE